MSYTFSCDYCGEPIDDEGHEGWVTLEFKASGWRRASRSGYLGHYHDGDGMPCFDTVRDAVALVKDYGTQLESIPVASGQAIAHQRCRHTKPDGTAVDLPAGRSEAEDKKREAAGTKLWQLGRFGEVSIPARQALSAAGIVCLEDAVHWTRKDLLALQDVGKQTVAKIDGALRERGLALRVDRADVPHAHDTAPPDRS